jgi:3'-phosphoadenosine 5'-phosphosulfate sulfotransferase (PAPS reductase)/FAD synthetase/3'-phosphoadenosine 5'-phosphosulfate sulfotransferase
VTLRVVVRGKKDADAVKAMLSRFYPEWSVEVVTLKGARSVEHALSQLESMGDSTFTVVLLGREDEKLARELADSLPPTYVVHVVPRARVRNARIEMIAQELLRARARFRSMVWWNEDQQAYVFAARARGKLLTPEKPEPSYEPFLGLGRTNRVISKLVGRYVPSNPLLVRMEKNVHTIFSGPELVAKLHFRDDGLSPKVLEVHEFKGVEVSIDSLLRANRWVLEAYEKASMEFLKSLGDFDTIIVPWSGGKDSTAALILAMKLYGRKRVTALFTDTGTEFPQTVEYVERMSKVLGVKVYRAYAGVDQELEAGRMPMPTHDNRWCTGLKIAAGERALLELASGRTLVILGDRDAESPRRSARPPVRGVGEIVFAAPLRFWSAAHVQLYIVAHGIPMNPLYEMGFYRIGCYMCPSLRSWEVFVMAETPLYFRLLRYPIFRRFLNERLLSKTRREVAQQPELQVQSLLGVSMCCLLPRASSQSTPRASSA